MSLKLRLDWAGLGVLLLGLGFGFFCIGLLGFLPQEGAAEMEIPAQEHLDAQWKRKKQNREEKMEEKNTSEGLSFFENFLYFKFFIIYF